LLGALPLAAATRPRYGGTLRVEIHDSLDAPDTPLAARRFASLAPGFTLQGWEPGRRAYFAADDRAAGGRPFLDGVEIQMARPAREQAIDFGLGKADVVESGGEGRPAAAGRRTWPSEPVRVVALVFQARVDPRLREALALAVDRMAIYNVLLQRQGEISGALLPQWLSGYAFLFATTADLARARALAAALPANARRITLAIDDPADQPMAERISLNARDAGLTVALGPKTPDVEARLADTRVVSTDANAALKALAAAMDLPEPSHADSTGALYAAEAALLDGFRAVPLFHLPDVYGAAARVQGGPGIGPLGEWRFQDLWIEGAQP